MLQKVLNNLDLIKSNKNLKEACKNLFDEGFSFEEVLEFISDYIDYIKEV